jgi:8-oxo-dGTP pyrophosphatase MutT (NUDIX family)
MANRKLKRFSGILVKCGNKFLLCKRSPDQSSPNIWSVPGGGVEYGEKPKETAIREFYEETNIDLSNEINDIRLVGTFNTYTKNDEVKGMMYIYYYQSDVEIYPDLDMAKDGHEHSECGYFNFMDLPIDDHKDPLFRLILTLL